MYATIRGKLSSVSQNHLVVETCGIGFKIIIPQNLNGTLPPLGEEILLHTSFVVRELSQTLYGFNTPEERNLFEELIEISGVGPKIALGLISHLTLTGLREVVLQEDLSSLCKVPGVGKKTAERLLVELKNRLSSFFLNLPASLPLKGRTSATQDAIKALVNLGYNHTAAHKAVKESIEEEEEPDLSTLITKALKRL